MTNRRRIKLARMGNHVMDARQVAEEFGMSKRTVLYAIERGILPSNKVGPKTILLWRSDVEEWIARASQHTIIA